MLSYPKLLLGSLLVIGVGCAKSTTPTSNTVSPSTTPKASVDTAAPGSVPGVKASRNPLDACALLTSRDLQAVQGEALKESKPSTRADGGFMISQCFYTLPTSTNSISLLVAQKGESAGARDPKEFWQETFHRSDDEDFEKERGREKARTRSEDGDKTSDKEKAQGREEEEERAASPQKIAGLGDEAYWTGNRVGGALYALKGNIYIRVSVGGPGDLPAKIKKAKALAQIILQRL